MPGVLLSTAPPRAFTEACARWAAGNGTTYDHAVVTSLTTATPLPNLHDPVEVGFHPDTRLPPPNTVHLFHEAKDLARSTYHAEATRAREYALSQALAADPPPPPPLFPKGLASAPAKKGLLDAAMGGIGKRYTARWVVARPVLVAAGPAFVGAVKASGWGASMDEEMAGETVVWTAGESVNDGDLVRTIRILLANLDWDIIAAGEPGLSNVMRMNGARATGLKSLWLRARIRFGMNPRVIRKKRYYLV